ncbi:hypothetical protein [Bdellovibrio bacteriovorus]|uniref:hypothetical protein n=1 Tax=Bdellovibrio bacteriovorus TaxID=959 RepID=UPI0035A683D5
MNIKLILTIIVIPLIFAFQNCSKLGTNGIAIDEQKLSLDAVEITDPTMPIDVGDITDPVTPTNPATPDDNSDDSSNEGDVDDEVVVVTPPSTQPSQPNTDTPQEIVDREVADAISDCRSSTPLSEVVAELDVKFNHEALQADVQKIVSLKGVFGSKVVVRAQGASLTSREADEVHINHTLLVLCDFDNIEKIKGTQNRIIVVGGEIQSISVNNSNVSIVNAKVQSVSGPNNVIKYYSLK